VTNASHTSIPTLASWKRRTTVVAGTDPLTDATVAKHQGISASAAPRTPQPAPADHGRRSSRSTPPRLEVMLDKSTRLGVHIGASKPRATRSPRASRPPNAFRASVMVAPEPVSPWLSAHPIFFGPPTSTHRAYGGESIKQLLRGVPVCQQPRVRGAAPEAPRP
jgi:hypothetical protein